MRHGFRALSLSAAVCAAALFLSSTARGQAPGSVAKTAAATKASETKAWTPPKTVDGQPDLQGVWSNATNIPLEKPREAAPARAGAYTNRQAKDRKSVV